MLNVYSNVKMWILTILVPRKTWRLATTKLSIGVLPTDPGKCWSVYSKLEHIIMHCYFVMVHGTRYHLNQGGDNYLFSMHYNWSMSGLVMDGALQWTNCGIALKIPKWKVQHDIVTIQTGSWKLFFAKIIILFVCFLVFYLHSAPH